MDTVGYADFVKADFVKLEEAHSEVCGATLLRAAFGDGQPSGRIGFCIAVVAMLGGFVAYLLSWFFGADGMYWWLLLEVIGLAAAGWFYGLLVRHHWLKRLGITDLNGSRWWERLHRNPCIRWSGATLRSVVARQIVRP